VSGRRLAAGGAIDRDAPIAFEFDGRRYRGYRGDTLASALLASGVRVVARSFKFHRPRGIVGAGLEEPNARVQLSAPRDEPNVLATTVALEPGLVAGGMNCWPSLAFDLGAAADRARALLPAGFYYKTFMWPPRAWPLYERLIRRAAGLGRAPRAAAAVETQRRFAHCDLLVAGAGPAGVAAALAAARSGARVILADDGATPGGALRARGDQPAALEWIARAAAELDALPNVRRLAHTLVFGQYEHGFVVALERRGLDFERIWKIRARRVVVATGAIERPLVFPDNDRPGVMLASAVRSYLHRHAVACGARVLVFCNNDDAYDTAFDCARAGIAVVAVADTREAVSADRRAEAARLGIDVLRASTVTTVYGRSSVRGARIAPLRSPGRAQRVDCDLIAVSGGWDPALHLYSQAGGKAVFDAARACFVPGAASARAQCAGAANGAFETRECLEQGRAAGRAAAQALGLRAADVALPQTDSRDRFAIQAAWDLPRGAGANAFVDLANDVTAGDIALAHREGYRSIEHMKRYTTAGMGADQGKTANVNAIGLMAVQRGVGPGEVGTTTYRPPYAPVAFGAIAAGEPGPLVRPARETPMTGWHEAHGAVMYESGANWRRPGYYPRGAETMADAVRRECLAVRTGAGLYDSSPLGKLEVRGPDAAGFLERAYAGRLGDLRTGRGRYGLMLREDGRLLDDGVVFRAGEEDFWISTTSGNAEAVHAWLEYLRQRVFQLRVFLTPVTAQWANAVVCGPRAREVLRAAGTDIDLRPSALPFMAMREGHVAGHAARVFRVGFTGELSYEINVHARNGLALWEALIAAGEAFGVTPVGSEANHALRVEKGYISIGHEADGVATPHDLGLGWAVDDAKPDFIGKRARARDADRGGARRELVGLLAEDPRCVLAEGAQITGDTGSATQGFVTAAVMSPALGRSIALALLDDGRRRIGETVRVTVESGAGLKRVAATVARPAFYDPEGERLRG
jgi:sarcosine oxidase subunit alpha